MLPKTHLTSHSRTSGSRRVITPLWLSGSWRSFLYSYSAYSCHLFLISSASVHTIFVLYFAHLCMKCSLCISNFLEETSSLSHCIVVLYFFALITEEGFHISPCYSLEFCVQMGISLLSSFAFSFSSFLRILGSGVCTQVQHLPKLPGSWIKQPSLSNQHLSLKVWPLSNNSWTWVWEHGWKHLF